jgi:hypothetical protein
MTASCMGWSAIFQACNKVSMIPLDVPCYMVTKAIGYEPKDESTTAKTLVC